MLRLEFKTYRITPEGSSSESAGACLGKTPGASQVDNRGYLKIMAEFYDVAGGSVVKLTAAEDLAESHRSPVGGTESTEVAKIKDAFEGMYTAPDVIIHYWYHSIRKSGYHHRQRYFIDSVLQRNGIKWIKDGRLRPNEADFPEKTAGILPVLILPEVCSFNLFIKCLLDIRCNVNYNNS